MVIAGASFSLMKQNQFKRLPGTANIETRQRRVFPAEAQMAIPGQWAHRGSHWFVFGVDCRQPSLVRLWKGHLLEYCSFAGKHCAKLDIV